MSRITAWVLAQHMAEHVTPAAFGLRVEQIKRLRGLAAADQSKANGLSALAAKWRAEADRLDAEADAARQMVDAWGEMADGRFTSGIGDEDAVWQCLTDGQRRGGHCIMCDGVITVDEPDERLGFLYGHAVFVHVDAAVCERVAAERAAAASDPAGFADGDDVNISDPEHRYFGVPCEVAEIHKGGLVAVRFANGDLLTLPAASLTHHASFVAQPQEFFDVAEAEDVARIQHEMDIEAGMECDAEACVYCGGAR